MKKLPSTIEIAGQRIKVLQVPDLIERDGVHGDWCPKTNTIRIQSQTKDIPADTVLATFFHETFHAALDIAGHGEWSKNEEFVERMGHLLYQAEKSRRYD